MCADPNRITSSSPSFDTTLQLQVWSFFLPSVHTTHARLLQTTVPPLSCVTLDIDSFHAILTWYPVSSLPLIPITFCVLIEAFVPQLPPMWKNTQRLPFCFSLFHLTLMTFSSDQFAVNNKSPFLKMQLSLCVHVYHIFIIYLNNNGQFDELISYLFF